MTKQSINTQIKLLILLFKKKKQMSHSISSTNNYFQDTELSKHRIFISETIAVRPTLQYPN